VSPIAALEADSRSELSARFDPGRTAFRVKAAGVELDYRVFALSVVPGTQVRIEASVPVQIEGPASLRRVGASAYSWKTPSQPGTHALWIRASVPNSADPASSEMRLTMFVNRASTEQKQSMLRGYRIGRYADPPFRNLVAYRPPRGFIEVDAALVDVPVSPHFRLGQFLCKQEAGWPKYLVLRPELLLKLEHILERINERGIRTDRLHVMSGFRTPWYNREIGNQTTSSRHLYGGAADIFIDESPRDGRMDDLNGDGRVDKADADFLYDLLEELSQEPRWQEFVGGLAAYAATPAHGPFVHVDARGYRARWGR